MLLNELDLLAANARRWLLLLFSIVVVVVVLCLVPKNTHILSWYLQLTMIPVLQTFTGKLIMKAADGWMFEKEEAGDERKR